MVIVHPDHIAVSHQIQNRLGEHLKEEDTMVILLPDHGTRYLGKIYNDDWMRAQGWL